MLPSHWEIWNDKDTVSYKTKAYGNLIRYELFSALSKIGAKNGWQMRGMWVCGGVCAARHLAFNSRQRRVSSSLSLPPYFEMASVGDRWPFCPSTLSLLSFIFLLIHCGITKIASLILYTIMGKGSVCILMEDIHFVRFC